MYLVIGIGVSAIRQQLDQFVNFVPDPEVLQRVYERLEQEIPAQRQGLPVQMAALDLKLIARGPHIFELMNQIIRPRALSVGHLKAARQRLMAATQCKYKWRWQHKHAAVAKLA